MAYSRPKDRNEGSGTLLKTPCLREAAGRAQFFGLYPGICLTTEEKSRKKSLRVEEMCQMSTIRYVDRTTVAVATDCSFKTP